MKNFSGNLCRSAAAFLLAACSGGASVSSISATPQLRSSIRFHGNGGFFKSASLIAFDNQSNTLEYWPIQQGGGSNPIPITSPLSINTVAGMASDNGHLAIAATSPSALVRYTFGTQEQTVIPDPGGPPIDLAMAKGDTAYVLNAGDVEGFPLDRLTPRTITCPYISNGVSIAVDDHGNVFVNGYGPGSFVGVVKYPYSDWQCTPLNLNPEQGSIGGIGIDPATDNLIVVDNPGSCNGGGDGRMTIYTPPYSPKTATQVNLNVTYCAGTFRLDATSETMFLMDSNGSQTQIDQFSYPEGQSEGVYSGGVPGAITTWPNTLPN